MALNIKRVKKIREFNRFYTKKIGLLKKKFLGSDFSLVQARIIFELSRSGDIVAKDLAGELDLDPAYLSKILKKFEKDGLILKETSLKDSRKQLLFLTEEGEKTSSYLQDISNRQTESLIKHLSEEKQLALETSMEVIKRSLSPGNINSEIFVIRPHRSGDIGYIVYRHGVLYSREYGFNEEFDGYVAKGLALFIENLNPLKEYLWIAEMGGTIIGSVAIVQLTGSTARLRWLIVESAAQNQGLGKKLVNEAVLFAGQQGYKKIILWTIDFLHAAQKLYSDAGFKLVEVKINQVWGNKIKEEKWELVL